MATIVVGIFQDDRGNNNHFQKQTNSEIEKRIFTSNFADVLFLVISTLVAKFLEFNFNLINRAPVSDRHKSNMKSKVPCRLDYNSRWTKIPPKNWPFRAENNLQGT